MAYKLQLKRGASGSLPTGSAGEPLFTTDTNDLYIGTGAANQRFQKYIASGTSAQFLKGDGSLDSNTYYLASNPSAYIALTALTASAPLSYNNTTGAFTISQASGSTNGYLSSTDWTTFNNKQNALTNPVTGTGTTNYLPKWTSGSALGNSVIYEASGSIGVGTTTITSGIPLTINAPTGSNTNIAFQQNSTDKWYLRNLTSTDDFSFYSVVGAAERLRLTSTGNLLVNSIVDNGNRLQVTGNASITGNVNVGSVGSLQINAGSASTPLLTQTTNYTEIYRRSGGVGIYLGGTSDPANYYYNSSHYFSSVGGATNYVTINSNGNVGINTQSPSALLHLAVASASVDGTKGVRIANPAGTTVMLECGVSNDSFVGTTSVSDFHIRTVNTERMRITSGGNLLVGTSTDSGERLQVNGGAYFSGNVGIGVTAANKLSIKNGASQLDVNTTTSTVTLEAIDRANTSNSINFEYYARYGSHVFYSGAYTERMRIKSDGKINFSSLPTSATGLSAGDIWNDGGTLKIV